MSKDNDHKLDSLIRDSARQFDTADFKIEDEEIYAYLQGELSEDGVERLQAALDTSAEFRSYLAGIALDYQSLIERSGVTAPHDRATPPSSLREAAKREQARTAKNKLGRKRIIAPILVLVATAATVLIMSILNTDTPKLSWSAPTKVELRELISNSVRGNNAIEECATAREAALGGIRTVVHYDWDVGAVITNASLDSLRQKPSNPDNSDGSQVVIRLSGGKTSSMVVINGGIFKDVHNSEFELWEFDIERLSLTSAALDVLGGVSSVSLSREDINAIYVVTYRQGPNYLYSAVTLSSS